MSNVEESNRLPVLAATIRRAHADVGRSAIALAERALEAGAALIEAKAALPHGSWEVWLKANTGLSNRTARRYMQLSSAGLKSATVAVLGLRGAIETIASWPLPEPGTVVVVKCTHHAPDELMAFIWPAKEGGFNTYVLDGECNSYVVQDGKIVSGESSGGSGTANKRAWPKEAISYVMTAAGFRRDKLRVERFPYASPGLFDDLRADILTTRKLRA